MNQIAPAIESAEDACSLARERHQQATARQNHLQNEIHAREQELAEIQRAVEDSIDHPRHLESCRAKRRDIRSRLNDLREELPPVIAKAEEAKVQLATAEVDLQNATRKRTQQDARIVAMQMRTLIHDLDGRLQQLIMLAEEDRRAKDMVYGLDRSQLSEATDFAWGSEVDQTFLEAIKTVIAECSRTERQLAERVV